MAEGIKPYKNSREHLSDELMCLNLLISRQVMALQSAQSADVWDEFRGLLVTDGEVNAILQENLQSNSTEELTSLDKVEWDTLSERYSQLRAQIRDRITVSIDQGIWLPLQQIASLFQLHQFEAMAVLICLAPEIDQKYEKLYAYLQDDVTRKKPSVDLILGLQCLSDEERDEARGFFLPQMPLLRYLILEFVDDQSDSVKPLISRNLKLDDRIVDFILGWQQPGFHISDLARLIQPRATLEGVALAPETKERMGNLTKWYFQQNPLTRGRLIYYFHGPPGSDTRAAAEGICQLVGLPLLVVDVEEMLSLDGSFERSVRLVFREALLSSCAIYLHHFDLLMADEEKKRHYRSVVARNIEMFSSMTFLSGENPWEPTEGWQKNIFIDVEFPALVFAQRKAIWKALTQILPLDDDVDIDFLASKFRLSHGKIVDSVAAARNRSLMRNPSGYKANMDDLNWGCRSQSSHKLLTMAQKVAPNYSWADIILPEDRLDQLKEICAQMKYRHVVYNNWGFDEKLALGKGLNVLFTGPSGTGKTMAADIIAGELELDLYKIDLSCVVSKYIGETEKNLSKVFHEAEQSNAILFFDEADALFGKRTEVKDAHDRYANTEINYLLQKMEEFEGVVILASNFKKNIDEAFMRRMHISVEFPLPDSQHRFHIWKGVFPESAPLADDIDFRSLARQFKISGGNIKNVAVAAAFFAAEEDGEIGIIQIIRAMKREYQKMGKICNETEFGKFWKMLNVTYSQSIGQPSAQKLKNETYEYSGT